MNPDLAKVRVTQARAGFVDLAWAVFYPSMAALLRLVKQLARAGSQALLALAYNRRPIEPVKVGHRLRVVKDTASPGLQSSIQVGLYPLQHLTACVSSTFRSVATRGHAIERAGRGHRQGKAAFRIDGRRPGVLYYGCQSAGSGLVIAPGVGKHGGAISYYTPDCVKAQATDYDRERKLVHICQQEYNQKFVWFLLRRMGGMIGVQLMADHLIWERSRRGVGFCVSGKAAQLSIQENASGWPYSHPLRLPHHLPAPPPACVGRARLVLVGCPHR